jgi:glycine oxidase
MHVTDFIIAGGGLIGLLTARELRQAGAHVTVVERGATGQESSWAGGGILSPLYPWRCPGAVTALVRWSQGHYPLLAHTLADETGLDVEWLQNGLMVLDVDEQTQALAWARQSGAKLNLLNRIEMLQHEPQLGASAVAEALWLPDVAQVRNPRLLKALRHSVLASGVRLKEQAEITGLIVDGDHVAGVETASERIMASKVVVTAGAWSDNLLRFYGEIMPVRGQMILFRAAPGLVSRIVVHNDHYVIPRRDGRVLAGSTVEYAGFDKSTTPQALIALRQAAVALVPTLAECEIEHHWAGLRPGTAQARNGVPYIGEHPRVRGLYVNTGHFRNGVVMAPASARLLADIIVGRAPIIDPMPYQIMDAP